MEKIVRVTDVRHLGGHRLRLDFDDGISGVAPETLHRLVGEQPGSGAVSRR